MGIYYYAADTKEMKIIRPPGSYANKSPGIFHPNNPFPGMVCMMNVYGYNYEIFNDCGWGPGDEEGYQEITEEVYQKYLETFKEEK